MRSEGEPHLKPHASVDSDRIVTKCHLIGNRTALQPSHWRCFVHLDTVIVARASFGDPRRRRARVKCSMAGPWTNSLQHAFTRHLLACAGSQALTGISSPLLTSLAALAHFGCESKLALSLLYFSFAPGHSQTHTSTSAATPYNTPTSHDHNGQAIQEAHRGASQVQTMARRDRRGQSENLLPPHRPRKR